MKKLMIVLLAGMSFMTIAAEEIIVAGDKIDLVKKTEKFEISYIIKSKRTEVTILRSLQSDFRGSVTIGCGGPSNAGGGCLGATTAFSVLEIDDTAFRIMIDNKGREFVEYVGTPSLILGEITSGRATEVPGLNEFRQLGFVQIPRVFNACGFTETELPSFYYQLPRRFTDGLIEPSEITNEQCSVYN